MKDYECKNIARVQNFGLLYKFEMLYRKSNLKQRIKHRIAIWSYDYFRVDFCTARRLREFFPTCQNRKSNISFEQNHSEDELKSLFARRVGMTGKYDLHIYQPFGKRRSGSNSKRFVKVEVFLSGKESGRRYTLESCTRIFVLASFPIRLSNFVSHSFTLGGDWTPIKSCGICFLAGKKHNPEFYFSLGGLYFFIVVPKWVFTFYSSASTIVNLPSTLQHQR